MTRALVVLPSYNERENLSALIDDLLCVRGVQRICVVDDSSSDGTAQMLCERIAANASWHESVHVVVRPKKDGRGSAVRDGFAWGLQSGEGFDAYVEMDCDFSHQPLAVPGGLELLEQGHDLVIGARYPNGTLIGWPLRRRVFSFLANQLARVLIDRRVPDYTNGFRFYSVRAARRLLELPQRHKGYVYLSESLSYLLRDGMKVTTFPIVFRNRDRGVSKTTLPEILSALGGLLLIARDHRRSRQ